MSMSVKEEFHPVAERRHHVAQRIGWALLAIGLLLAVLGLFGDGIFSDASKTASAEGIEVSLDYSRFARMRKPDTIALRIDAPQADGMLSVTLSQDFVSAISINGISPRPDSTSISPDGHTYSWSVEDWSEQAFVAFEYEPDTWRRVKGDIRVAAGERSETISFSQFVFP